MGMYGCLQSSTYNMLADVMDLNISQNYRTGEFVREWVVAETIQCLAKTIIEDSSTNSASGKSFGKSFSERQSIKLKSPSNISTRKKVTNIRNSATQVDIFTENKIDNRPTIYDVEASVPVFDPFGSIIYYDVLLYRSDVQDGN